LEPPLVSIVIPVSIPNNIAVCLRSLKKIVYPNFEVIAVVNSNSNAAASRIVSIVKEEALGFPEILKKRVHLIVKPKMLGYAAACNIGYKSHKGKYVLFLNDDAVVESSCLCKIVEIHENDPAIACVQPKILSLKNTGIFDYAGAAGGFIDIYGVPFCAGRIFEVVEKDKGQYDDVKEIFWASGTALFCRSSSIDEVGLFDETFFAYMEEIDFAFRVCLRGYRIVLAPNARVYHLGAATSESLKIDRDFLAYKNNLLVLLKNYEIATLTRVMPIRCVLDASNFLMRLAKKKLRLAVNVPRAYADLLFRSLRHALEENRRVRALQIVKMDSVRKKMLPRSIALLHTLKGVRYFSQVRNMMPCR